MYKVSAKFAVFKTYWEISIFYSVNQFNALCGEQTTNAANDSQNDCKTLLARITLCTHYVYINIHEVFDYDKWLNEVKDVNRQWESHVMDNAVSTNEDQLSGTISHLN